MRRELTLAAIGAVLLAAGVYLVSAAHGPSRYFLLNANRDFPAVPVVVLEPTAPPLNGSVMVIHGLGANRVVMLTLGQRLAAAGLRVFLFDAPGHGNNTSPFSFARAQACAAAVIHVLASRGDIDLHRTVLLGHSMGGAIALVLGTRFEFAATIAVAPAPELLPRGIPANLLLITPQFDVPAILQMERKVSELGRGRGHSTADFSARTAFFELPLWGRTHTGTIFDATAARETARWAAASMGASLPAEYVMPSNGLLGGLSGFLGLCFLFPLVSSAFAQLWRVRPKQESAQGARPVAALFYWTISALLGVALLAFWVPLEILHLYSGSYLASLLLIAGIPLLILLAPRWTSESTAPRNTLGMAVTLGLATFLAFSAWVNWQLADSWMNSVRWERFPFLAVVLLPYCLAEEFALGPSPNLKVSRCAGRFALGLLLRFILWFAAAYALFTGLSDAVLLFFLVVYLAAFSVGQRLAADAIRRRTGSAAAAAVFSAILGAWFVAAAFPLL